MQSANTTLICFVENAPNYNGIVHQRDVWHGAKNVTTKVIDVSFCICECRYIVVVRVTVTVMLAYSQSLNE